MLFIWVSKMAVKCCKEGGKRVEDYLICLFSVCIRCPTNVDPHRPLCFPSQKLVGVPQLVLHIRKPCRVARGLQDELVFESLQLHLGSIESIRVGYLLSSVAGFGGCGGAGQAVHDQLGIC